MATILVIDDRPPNREALSTLLGSSGLRLLEAADVREGLELARTQRPDLVLCTALTRDVDGHEFLRLLRADAAIAATPVVLCSADPGADDADPGPLEVLVTNRLFDTVDELRRQSHRLRMMVELTLQLLSHRDPALLLDDMCRGACALVGARHGMVAVREPGPAGQAWHAFCGVPDAVAARLVEADLTRGALNGVTARRLPLRLRLPDAAAHGANGLPPEFPATNALLAAPILSPRTVLGWICLSDKPDGSAFSDDDELLLSLLGQLVGRGYESGALYLALKRRAAQQLEAMSWRLVEAQETERRQLSRELHDRVGQSLTALGINLDILRTQGLVQDRADLRPRLDDSIALLRDTVGAIEDVMAELRPPMLDDHGLLAALQWYVDQFARRTGIAAAVAGDATVPRPDPNLEITLFRIAQEALNNVAKHARASRVDVELRQTPDGYDLSVADDGVGFDPGRLPPRAGRGMVTMRERAQSVGGRLEMRTQPGGGTRVCARIRPSR